MPKEKQSTQIVLVNHGGLGRMHVNMEAFFEFSFWLAEELEDLVSQWAHLAAPNATARQQISSEDRPR